MDTNVLLRAAVADDPNQAEMATEVMAEAELIAVPLEVLCEFAWVLRRSYKRSPEDIAASIHRLIESPNVVANFSAVEAGLSILEAGGDFADGVIAYQGRMLGGQTFVSFDRDAVGLIAGEGISARLLD